MNSFFVAALSFVGVLGTAAGAMAVNADTLGHSSGDALTEASSKSLVASTEVGGRATAAGAPTASAIPGASTAATPAAVQSISLTSIDGTTGGSSAGGTGTPTVAKPQPGKATPVQGGAHAVTGGSTAVPAPTNGTDPAPVTTKPKKHGDDAQEKQRENHQDDQTQPTEESDDQSDD